MNTPRQNSAPLQPSTPGWVLVTVVMLLCVLGTWFTARNYKAQVFSSTEGVVLENQWPESRISVSLPPGEASKIHPGHGAKITIGNNAHLLMGKVLSVTPGAPGSSEATVIIGLIGNQDKAGEAHQKNFATDHLPPGTKCDVTIDTTVPPQAETTSQ